MEDKSKILSNEQWEQSINLLQKFISYRVNNEQDVQDILQDVLIKIYKNIDYLEDQEKFNSWLIKVTRNTIVDYYRKKGRNLEVTMGTQSEMEQFMQTSSEDEENLNKVISSRLKGLMEGLPPEYKEALVLTEFENYTQTALAEKLGISISGAKSRVQRGRKKLKDLLINCCHLEMDQMGNVLDYKINNGPCACKEIKKKDY